jgi:hypothetical protein
MAKHRHRQKATRQTYNHHIAAAESQREEFVSRATTPLSLCLLVIFAGALVAIRAFVYYVSGEAMVTSYGVQLLHACSTCFKEWHWTIARWFALEHYSYPMSEDTLWRHSWWIHIFQHHWYQSVFSLSVLVYGFFYSRFSAACLSHQYRDDKYGIVFVYAVVVVVKTYTDLQMMNRMVMAAVTQDQQGTCGFVCDRINPSTIGATVIANHVAQLQLTLLAGLKILAFNMIFKNHTSEHDTEHQKVHLLMVVLLAAVACIGHIQTATCMGADGENFLYKKMILAGVSGGLYQIFFDRHTKQTAPWKKAIILLLESQLVEQTL